MNSPPLHPRSLFLTQPPHNDQLIRFKLSHNPMSRSGLLPSDLLSPTSVRDVAMSEVYIAQGGGAKQIKLRLEKLGRERAARSDRMTSIPRRWVAGMWALMALLSGPSPLQISAPRSLSRRSFNS